MRAVIIDPWNRTVYATDEAKWGLKEMYNHLSGPDGFRPCDDINSVRIGRDQMLWVDGEGLLIPDVPVWNLRGYDNPLAGKGLVLGVTEMGDNKATHLQPEWVQSMLVWTNLKTTGKLLPDEYFPGGIKIGAPILREDDDGTARA